MQVSSARAPSSPPEPEQGHRARLVEGMADALAKKAYGDISVADIVQHARVSKRTFYEHFADKEACYLATYAALSEDVLQKIAIAAAPELPIERRLESATRAYLSALEEKPDLTRTFLADLPAVGPRALKMRRKIHGKFASLLRLLVERGRKERTGVQALSAEMAVAVVGGINELILLTVEEGRGHRLGDVAETVIALLRAVLLAPSPRRPSIKPSGRRASRTTARAAPSRG